MEQNQNAKPPRRYILDGNIFNLIAADSTSAARLRNNLANKNIELINTQIQIKQIESAPKLIQDIFYTLTDYASTACVIGIIPGYTTEGWHSDDTGGMITKILGGKKPNLSNLTDAGLIATSSSLGASFVTNDRHARNAANRLRIRAIDWDKFTDTLANP